MAEENNPILNNPYEEPKLHYNTDSEGNLNYEDIRKGRRFFTPDIQAIPARQGPQKQIFEVNDFPEQYGTHLINLTRIQVSEWRNKGYPNTTRVTKELLDFWFNNKERIPTKKLFFAQREAIETAIWLNEVAQSSNPGNHILNLIHEGQATVSDNKESQLPRISFKMATGSGKTVVMACIILYHYFNRKEYRSDTRFADYFLIVAPGITIKDRLGVLYVDSAAKNNQEAKDYYYGRSLVPLNYEKYLDGLNARLKITNYHQFEPKTLQGNKRSPLDGKIGPDGKKQEAKEDFGQVIKNTIGNFKTGSRLLIINDEAHHCYLPLEKGKNTDEENSAEENERAAVWFTGLRELNQRFKIRNVYDLSATPYYLKGSGHQPYSLFPWVVSDFGLIEAIESGLVKIPYLPESDSTQELTMPVLRNLYDNVKQELPKKGQRKAKSDKKKGDIHYMSEDKPALPIILRTALDKFVNNYKEYDAQLGKMGEKRADLFTEPPVFIAVCNNTSVSKEVYKYIAGYEYEDGEGNNVSVPGQFDVFSNFDPISKQPKRKPPTLLIDSDSLENSNQVSDEFKKVFEPEIQKFKQEYRTYHPDKSVENLTDSDILREVVNTVGKRGALGSHIRCVVSVSMLTEGWDANTVTHIMGLRAFGSQLLCEQVAGRALRRRDYHLDPKTNKFPPEYAHIIGVPFKMFKGGKATIAELPEFKHIKAMPERQEAFEIVFPNLTGYRMEIAEGDINADFSDLPFYEMDFTKIPRETLMQTAVSPEIITLEIKSHRDIRDAQAIFILTKNLIRYHYSDLSRAPQFQKFNKLKNIVSEWYHTKIVIVGDPDPDLKRLIIFMPEKEVADQIQKGIEKQRSGKDLILPVFNINKFGSTRYVNGNTSRKVYPTTKSHVNFVVADTDSWEQIAAKTLEELPQVVSYVKNAFLGFQIPYSDGEKDKQYFPDFIARCKTPDGKMINLIIEITGMAREKANKKYYVMNRWLPAVNTVKDQFGYDEWHFIEIANDIRTIKEQLVSLINNIDKVIFEKDNAIALRLEKVKKSFGTIKSDVNIDPESMRRENLYE
jgi:type III restriction enzyme